MTFANVYDDPERAEAYASLDYPGTYYLAFRDLPEIIVAHVAGRTALDFGCGAGRSTRFLKSLGFDTVGIDISASMLELARASDAGGTYLRVDDGDLGPVAERRFDLVLSAFAFDNIPGRERRAAQLRGLGGLLRDGGRVVLLGSTPEIYTHEWASFTTKDFPENRRAASGERVQIVMKDVADARPVVDLVWSHDDYLTAFDAAGLTLIARHLPLGRVDDPRTWVSETTVAPWVIYVVGRR
jgi:SAM-dependent methyltransferase